ncbi:heme ABC transporter ATP-binding protein [Thioalkalivibrio sp. ALJT]|uniref:heme ABC transporter ATP-binding protein n=1 Tax=Thioalkalivibrio sp. ALJT TaxID=1158146 RepID=UPI0003A2CAFE|nr:heme ABC transporter ATP-binding protein [Thioalkalivibrio sp. ALJT]
MSALTQAIDPPGDSVLEVSGVSVRGQRGWRLQEASLSVMPGEIHAVMGPNGAGKSTLLSVLSGTLEPDAGEILFDGHPLPAWCPGMLARRRGILPQETTVSFPLTAWEVAALGRLPHATPLEDPEIVRRAMHRMDVLHLAPQRYSDLSGGERQRVQMARVLAQVARPAPDPAAPVLRLDEPSSALDLRHQFELFERMRDEARAGSAILVILHDLNLAGRYADRLTLLHDGRVAAQGRPRDILDATILERVWGVRARVTPGAAGAPLQIHLLGPAHEPVRVG